MVPPSLPSALTASCRGAERYFQATAAILRLPRGPAGWEGSARVEGRGRVLGLPGKCSVVAISLSKRKASVRIGKKLQLPMYRKGWLNVVKAGGQNLPTRR